MNTVATADDVSTNAVMTGITTTGIIATGIITTGGSRVGSRQCVSRADTGRSGATRPARTASTTAARVPVVRPTERTSMPTVVIRTTPPQASRAGATRPIRSGRLAESTYRRRRAVVGVVLAVLVAASVVVAHDVLVGPGGDPAFAAPGRPRDVVTITARPGDTLWSIGEQHRGSVPIRRYVDALIALNGGPAIQAGQSVSLP